MATQNGTAVNDEATKTETTTNRVANVKVMDSFDRFYGRARKAGKGVIPVEYSTPKGTITVSLPLPAALTHEAALAEAQENGFGYTIPTKGSLIGGGVAKDAKGKMKGEIAVEALDDLSKSQ